MTGFVFKKIDDDLVALVETFSGTNEDRAILEVDVDTALGLSLGTPGLFYWERPPQFPEMRKILAETARLSLTSPLKLGDKHFQFEAVRPNGKAITLGKVHTRDAEILHRENGIEMIWEGRDAYDLTLIKLEIARFDDELRALRAKGDPENDQIAEEIAWIEDKKAELEELLEDEKDGVQPDDL